MRDLKCPVWILGGPKFVWYCSSRARIGLAEV